MKEGASDYWEAPFLNLIEFPNFPIMLLKERLKSEKSGGKRMGYLFAIGSAVLYGTMPFLAKEIYACGGTELTVVALRFLFAVPIVFLIVRIMNIPLKITLPEFGKLFLLAQGYVLTNILLCFSYNYISSGMSTTIHFIYPALVFLIHVLIFSEKFDRIKLICSVLGLAVLGIALMGETLNFRTAIGITCVLASAVLIVMGKANKI